MRGKDGVHSRKENSKYSKVQECGPARAATKYGEEYSSTRIRVDLDEKRIGTY